MALPAEDLRAYHQRRPDPDVDGDVLARVSWLDEVASDAGQAIADLGLHRATTELAARAYVQAALEQPLTVRGLFYRVVSSAGLPSTDKEHYNRLKAVAKRLREADILPWRWIVDGLRQMYKPSSWSGLADFAETTRNCYRKDLWAAQAEYVHVFCEKDAMAGVLRPVADEYDIALSIIRGYSSLTMVHEVAEVWAWIKKPITAYYLGDFDSSGMDIERDLREKLKRYAGRDFTWVRLAVTAEDFATFNLFPLKPKKKDKRTRAFLAAGHTECAEIDAIPADRLRERLREAIESHIDTPAWERLRKVEQLEAAQWDRMCAVFGGNGATA
jgi:hypothetical protein